MPQVVVLKDVSFGEALSYSKTIVSGRWRKVFFYSMVFIPIVVLEIVLGLLHFFTSHQFVAVIYDVSLFPIKAYGTILLTLLFVNMQATPAVEVRSKT